MKQVAQNPKTGSISVEVVPEPLLRAGCVLVRTEWSLVSAGTEKSKIDFGNKSLIGKARSRPDLVRQVAEKVKTEGLSATVRAVRTRLDSLSPLGYSCAGTVIAVDSAVSGVSVGDRVACGGGEHAFHAGVVCVPVNLCAVLPDAVDTELGAYATVGAIALQGIRQADVRLGERVLVVGLGLVGQLTVQMLVAAGCSVAGADLSARQLELALKGGCGLAVDASDSSAPARLMAFAGGAGFDAVLVTAASKDPAPLVLGALVARDRARVVLVGDVRIDLPRAPFYDKELSLVLSRSYGPGRYDPQYEEHGHDYPIGYVRWTEQRNMAAFLGLVESGGLCLDVLTTHRFDVDEAPRAYEMLGSGSEPYTGVLLRYPVEDARTGPQRLPDAPSGRPATSGADRNGVVLVGSGSFAGRVLVPALVAAGSLKRVAVVSAHGLSAVDAARKFGFESAQSDAAIAFGLPGVGAAMIATRHDSHAELTLKALVAGLSVFVEKPLCIRVEDVGAIVRAQRETGATCIVGFNRRFAPATALLTALRVKCGGMAHVLIRVNAGQIPASHWIRDPYVGGGRVVGEMCHFVDLACAIAGSAVRSVNATALGVDSGPEQAESVSAELAHVDGSVSTVVYTAQGNGLVPKEYVELHVAGSSAVIDDFRKVTTYVAGRSKTTRFKGQDKGHAAEVAAFSEAVVSGGCVAGLSFEECVDSTAATFAVLESIRTGSRVDVGAFMAEAADVG